MHLDSSSQFVFCMYQQLELHVRFSILFSPLDLSSSKLGSRLSVVLKLLQCFSHRALSQFRDLRIGNSCSTISSFDSSNIIIIHCFHSLCLASSRFQVRMLPLIIISLLQFFLWFREWLRVLHTLV